MDPVILRSLCLHDYESGEPINDYDLSDYKEKWGHEYLMFHRQDMHRTLLKTAVGMEGDGPPCKLYVNHRVESVDAEDGRVVFTNGRIIEADLIVGSDGIRVSHAVAVSHLKTNGACSVNCARRDRRGSQDQAGTPRRLQVQYPR